MFIVYSVYYVIERRMQNIRMVNYLSDLKATEVIYSHDVYKLVSGAEAPER